MRERGNAALRFFDRYFGIPMIYGLRLFKFQRRAFPKSIRKIAMIKSAGIGDTIILSGLIRDLKEFFPTVEITLFTGFSNFEAGCLIEGIQLKKLPISRPFKALKLIRKKRFDVWMDCDPWPRINALFSFFSRSEFTIGFKTKNQARHLLYDCPVRHSFECHELDNYRKLAEPFKVKPSKLPRLLTKVCKPPDPCKIALHIFSGGSRAYLKHWPIGYWNSLIEILSARGFEILMTGSAADYSKIQDSITCPAIQNFSGALNLNETANLLKTCSLVISVDTGIMHLAAAIGCKVIGLHGPTSPLRWGALGEETSSISPELFYKPCIELGFESKCKENHCMRSISVEQVLKTIERTLYGKNESIDIKRRGRDSTLASFSK